VCGSSYRRKSKDGYCGFISTSRVAMRQHLNQQHSVQLSRWSTASAVSYAEHAAQLWKPVKVQTFFQERRYVRYFTVQEQHQQEQSPPRTVEQQEAESGKQLQAALLHEWEAVAGKDRDAIEQIAKEASTKDRTGWFKRTRWDEHLQAYPDWLLLSYAVRLPASDEPALQCVVQLVEELLEQAVQGLSTLSLETLRWLRSPHPKDIDVRPFSRYQNRQSQLRAARLWARLLCYCLRVIAVEQQIDQAEEPDQPSQPSQPGQPGQLRPSPASPVPLEGIARLFPWHSRQS
jgi:hypothetical protein